MRYLLCILLLTSAHISINAITTCTLYFSSDSINQTNKDGQKKGLWIVKDDAGLTTEKGHYTDGVKTGIWEAYHKNGNLKHKITFTNGEARGPASFYYEDGKLWESGHWEVDHWTGKYQLYYENGQLNYDWNFNEKGKREGPQKYFHKNGKRMYEGSWSNGRTNGTLKVYNNDGNLIEEKNFDDGKVISQKKIDVPEAAKNTPLPKFTGSGNHTIYNLNGQIDAKGEFIKGDLINGEKYIYNADNTLMYIIVFKAGKEVERRKQE